VDLSAPARARHLVVDALKGSPLVELTEPAVLVVSELVTNALRYTSGRLDLDVWCGPTFVQLGVADDAPGDPVTQPPARFRAGGRGLPLIDAIVSWRAIDHDAAGKTIWCQLDVEGPAAERREPPQ
jgi:hypothetical protein